MTIAFSRIFSSLYRASTGDTLVLCYIHSQHLTWIWLLLWKWYIQHCKPSWFFWMQMQHSAVMWWFHETLYKGILRQNLFGNLNHICNLEVPVCPLWNLKRQSFAVFAAKTAPGASAICKNISHNRNHDFLGLACSLSIFSVNAFSNFFVSVFGHNTLFVEKRKNKKGMGTDLHADLRWFVGLWQFAQYSK